MDFKCSVSFCVVLCFVVGHGAEMNTMYNVDMHEILRNQRLYKNYFDCLTNERKCRHDGKQLKETYCQTSCSRVRTMQRKTEKSLRESKQVPH
ncbi:ejaculatory bulb-specific protein 3-like [Cimex lectularius]|uniref:Secreted protein n=1 Tax=Cimex lectularius TaxID=79782 RepID=A0A8I6RZF9_CIMLE|nr:ejaculatory bulb-specific protein 3-like [Cimex lectularius]